MSGNPLDKRRDTRTSGASSIAGCGWTEIQHNLCFVDDEGQLLPAAGARYRLQVPHGATIYGVLDDNGYASHDGVGFGTVLYEIEPHIDDEKQLILKEIKQAMDEFIAAERKESEVIKARMQNKSDLEEDWEYTKAAGRGGRNAVVGVFDAAVDLSINVGKEALHLLSYFNPLAAPYAYERDVARVKQAKKELQAIADADWKLYATLMNDDETQKLFKQFASDYLDAQHSLEITEGTTEVITIILGVVALKAAAAISTTGAGTSKLAQLGGKLVDPIKRLIDVLKRAQVKKKVKGDGNQRLESRVEIEDNSRSVIAKSAPNKKLRETGARRVLDPVSLDAFDVVDSKYNAIRANSSDVGKIAENTGWPESRVERIKEHIFFKEHQLDSGTRQFDADPDMYNAWNRLEAGDFVQSDIDLLNHEIFESKFEGIFKTDYRTAHDATIRSGRTWTPE